MPRVRNVPPTKRTEPVGEPRKHPLLLALVAGALVAWLSFLAWLAFRG
jgi:hypothetical protein